MYEWALIWAGNCYVFVRGSANVNLTQLDQNDLPRILLNLTCLTITVTHSYIVHACIVGLA